MSKCLTIDDVRLFILDRTAEDNELDMDLSFSDEEIASAMRRAAREANDIPPYTVQVSGDCLPGASNIWLHAVTEQLYLSKLSNLMRNDIDYEAGGVSVTVTKSRIAHFKDLVKLHRSIWEDKLRRLKVGVNVRRFHYYGGC